jgi:hypothetical protein
MNKGSEWRKWNFHVHTKGTNKNDQFSSPNLEKFFFVFFKKAFQNNISAIGITDYFSIERYKDTINYINDIENKCDKSGEKLFKEKEIEFLKDIFIFPNVELRMLPSTDRGKLINIHCLFNPDYVPKLEHDFFSNIKNQDNFQLNRYGITSYGKKLEPGISDEDHLYKKGIANMVIDLSSLKNILQLNSEFRKNTLLVVSNSSKDGASAIQKHYDLFEKHNSSLDGLRKSIYNISDAIFSANQNDVRYFLGRRLEGTAEYNEKIHKNEVESIKSNLGSLKPCIVGCDAHCEDELFKKFTWVKADLNFEGLRQICDEPEQRVKIQDDEPDFKEEKLIIDKVRYISPNNVFSKNPIYLNPNLNVIIGGKSSGKSILLFSIAKTLAADLSVLKNEDGSFKYSLNDIENDFNFEITTKGGFPQKLIRSPEENSILPEIKYIPQNYLVKLAEPELNNKGKSLKKLVRDLILEDEQSSEEYQEFIKKVKQNDKKRNILIDSFFETRNELKELNAQLKTKSNKSVLQKNIEANTKKVEDLNKSIGLSKEEIKEYESYLKELEINGEQESKLKDDFSVTKEFDLELKQIVSDLNKSSELLLSKIQTPEIKESLEKSFSCLNALQDLSNFIAESLTLDKDNDGKKSFKFDSSFKEVLSRIRSKKNELNKNISPYLKNREVKKLVESINVSILNDKKALADIEKLTERIYENSKILEENKSDLFFLYKENFQEYINVISLLKSRTVELEKDGLSIQGKAKFNYKKLRERLIPLSDGRTASFNNYEILDPKLNQSDELDFNLIISNIELLFSNILNGEYALTSRAELSNTIKIVLDDYFYDYWEIAYKNDKLGVMSTGKASFVILMLIIGLSKSKAPILIDQPEDNLDNRSITTDLVNYLRNKKLERQIIVVTHNANIVVNADAENIIVANQKGQNGENSSSSFKFDYVNGSLENSFEKNTLETDVLKSMGIRQHIAEIVEGGKEAFLMREKKYRFS